MTQAQSLAAERIRERARLAAALALRKTGNNVIACMGFSILGLLGAFFFAPKWWEALGFVRNAVATEAQLDNDYVENTSRRNGITFVSYRVGYSYVVGGTNYHGGDTIEAKPQGSMQVFYDARNPGLSRIEYMGHFWIDTAILGILVVVTVAAVLGFLVFRARWRVLRGIVA